MEAVLSKLNILSTNVLAMRDDLTMLTTTQQRSSTIFGSPGLMSPPLTSPPMSPTAFYSSYSQPPSCTPTASMPYQAGLLSSYPPLTTSHQSNAGASGAMVQDDVLSLLSECFSDSSVVSSAQLGDLVEYSATPAAHMLQNMPK